MINYIKDLSGRLKGYRTLLFAWFIAMDPVLETLVMGGEHFDAERFFRQCLIAFIMVALRMITNTPMGDKGS